MRVMWFTINGELLKRYPDMPYLEMRADAHCAVLLMHLLKDFVHDSNMEILRRLDTPANTLCPKLWNLDTIMDGYIGECEIERTELVRRCEVILRRAMETIKYKE